MLSVAATEAANRDTPDAKVARRALLTDRRYYVVDSDGRQIGGHWFEIHADGRFVGQTMCGNSFQGTIEWTADNASRFDATTHVDTMTAAGCTGAPLVAPPEGQLRFDHLTADGHVSVVIVLRENAAELHAISDAPGTATVAPPATGTSSPKPPIS
jgi:hypothetical protein